MNDLIKQLNASEYQNRIDAQAILLTFKPAALSEHAGKLVDIIKNGNNGDVRWRALRVLREVEPTTLNDYASELIDMLNDDKLNNSAYFALLKLGSEKFVETRGRPRPEGQ